MSGGKRGSFRGPSTFEMELSRIQAEAHLESSRDHWLRPLPKSLDPMNENLVFQQTDIEHYQGPQHEWFARKDRSHIQVPIMRLFGTTSDQNSVLCHVHGFLPYLYIPCPHGMSSDDIPDFVAALIKLLSPSAIGDVKLMQKASIYGFSREKFMSFLKISVTSPNHLNAVRKLLEGGFAFGRFSSRSYPTFESNMPIVLRFMVDARITGMNWIELPARKYYIRQPSDCSSTCQYEVDILYIMVLRGFLHLYRMENIVSHVPEGEWSNLAPLRILSFDIECAGRKGIFPEASQDPVIQIASIVTIQGEKQPKIRTVFSFRSCAPIVGAEVFWFETEEEMLMAWLDFFQTIDPDMVVGYNICNFDFEYLLDRARALKLDKFPFLGRLTGILTKSSDTFFSSKAHGTRESKTFSNHPSLSLTQLDLDGRIIFDILQVMQRDYKLRSYSLNSVCSHFLGEQKEDVPHGIITDLFDGNEETRRRLAVYCLKDAYLPQRLVDKLMCIFNYTEMARVTGIPFNYILSRGQQVKVISQLYRKAADDGYVIPALKSEMTEEQYEGATVIEPTKGYYDVPIATLDFASLYPSIMMAHNLCYTTLIEPSTLQNSGLDIDDYVRTPSGDLFVKTHIRKGILPIILEDLISARKKAKIDLKKELNPFRRAVLDGRQLALKISANSVYGFTGATIGKLPCIPISQSVTAFGREMIEKTKDLVEMKFTIKNGYAFDAKVIYGDTDSVMIKFGPEQLEDVMKLGKEAAEFVSTHFTRPVSLEFEKCYFPYLLINKKRYAGLYWTNTKTYDKLDSKGIETVRRDNCRLVQTVIDTSLRKILIDRDVEGAKFYVKQVIADLLQNKIDLSQLVITKALSKAGEDYAGKQAHVELAERMKKRDAATAPNLGDRVAYVIVRGSKGTAAYEKSEDPIYVLENNIPIDTQYYLENQLSKPLMRIFEPILDNPKELLAGEHTRSVKVSAPIMSAMSKFTVKLETCLGCRVTLKKGSSLVCDYCKPRMAEIYFKHLSNLNAVEERYARLWTQCQRCQGSLHQDVLCTSRDCPIFYMRKKTQKDMEETSKLDDKFSTYSW